MDLILFHKAVDKYLAGTATVNEQKLVEAYWKRFSAEDLSTLTDADRQRLHEAIHAGVYEGIHEQAPVIPLYKKKLFRVAAAVLIICLAAAAYYSIIKSGADSETIIAQHDITPANEGATLTLADGRVIQLDSSANGALSSDEGTLIIKNDGQLTYNSGKLRSSDVVYNTLSTARGRNYHLTLSDGTKVYLDAMSSIKYPAIFPDKNRIVEITGQVYFEIAKNSKKPFIVKSENQEIQVLGTEFNINTYSTPVTTLISGSIKLSAANKSVILKPLQQSILSNGSLITNDKINIDIITAWRQNQFRFDGSNIKEIMTEVSRWYDIEVEYKDNISEEFVAKISRNVPLSKLLDLLQMTNQVKFNIKGNKVTVLKP